MGNPIEWSTNEIVRASNVVDKMIEELQDDKIKTNNNTDELLTIKILIPKCGVKKVGKVLTDMGCFIVSTKISGAYI